MRILVVEDEKRIADFLCRGLEGAGYAVDAAPTGTDALENIHSTDYDLVVLDLMVPDMDGLQVLERVRSRKTGPPGLLPSARGGPDRPVRGVARGAAGARARPVTARPAHSGKAAGSRSHAGLHPPQGNARLRWHRSGAQGVRHPRIHDAQPRPAPEPYHDRGARVGQDRK